MLRSRKSWVKFPSQCLFGLVLMGLLVVTSCGAETERMQGEIEVLKQQVMATQDENAQLRKQVEILSGTVRQLSELNEMLQKKEEGPEKEKVEEEKPSK